MREYIVPITYIVIVCTYIDTFVLHTYIHTYIDNTNVHMLIEYVHVFVQMCICIEGPITISYSNLHNPFAFLYLYSTYCYHNLLAFLHHHHHWLWVSDGVLSCLEVYRIDVSFVRNRYYCAMRLVVATITCTGS
jgi:hypothetical protein